MTDTIPDLENHVESRHTCTACGSQWYDVQFHRCQFVDENNNNEGLQVGYGANVSIPLDSNNNPVFEESARTFHDTIVSYTYKYTGAQISDVMEGVELIRTPLEQLINEYLRIHRSIRIKESFEILFYSPKDNRDVQKRYTSVPFKILHRNFVSDVVTDIGRYISSVCDLLSHEISGLIIRRLLQTEITIMKLQLRRMRGYIPLCSQLARKRALINVKNSNGKCLAYSVACCLNYKTIVDSKGDNVLTAKGAERKALRRQLERQSTWDSVVNNMDLHDGHFYTDFKLVKDFEVLNSVSISILRFSKKAKGIVPARLTSLMLPHHVFLLLISRKNLPKNLRRRYRTHFHLVSILDIGKFLAVKSKGFKYVCRFCFAMSNDDLHEQNCYSQNLTKLTLPKTKFSKFSDHHKLVMPPTFFVYQLLFSGERSNIQVTGFSLLAIDSHLQIKYSKTYVGDHAMNYFLDEVLLNGYYFLKQDHDNQVPLRKTTKHIEEMQHVTHCYVCGDEPTPSNKIVAHHNHHSRLVNGLEVKGHELGHPIWYVCNICNLGMVTRHRIPVYGYNLSHHGKFILRNLSSRGVKSVSIIPLKTSESYGSIIINNKIQFLDLANHFNSTNLHSIFQSVDNDDLHLLKCLAKTDYDFNLLRKGLPYPSFKKAMPPLSEFIDIRYLDEFTIEHYTHVITSYDHFKCSELNDYAKLSLEADSYGLASLIINYAIFGMSSFNGINPCWDISVSSYAYSVLHYISKTRYENLLDGQIIKILQDSILPGISLSNVKRADFKSRRLNDDVDTKDNSEGLMVDMRSQFASILMEPMPVGSYEHWDPEKISEFRMDYLDEPGDTRYIIQCSLNYPGRLHKWTQSLPLGYSRVFYGSMNCTELEREMVLLDQYGTKFCTLDLSCHHKTNIWISGEQLKLYIKIGMKLISIRDIVTYKVSNHLAPFAQRCINVRKTSKNSFYAQIAKSIVNLAVGKFQQRNDSLRTILTTSKKQTEKYLSSRLFVDSSPLCNDLGLVVVKRKKTLPAKNILFAWHVLAKSVYHMYNFFYNEVKQVWGRHAYLLYAQTDSLILKLSQVENLFKDLEKIKHCLDLSSLPKDCYLYNGNVTATEGLWKVESIHIRQFLSLRQKTYSLLEEVSDCQHPTTTSCSNCVISRGIRKKQVCHFTYLDILERRHSGFLDYRSLQNHNSGNLIVQQNHRQFLSHGSSNRIWKSPYKSKPFGYKPL